MLIFYGNNTHTHTHTHTHSPKTFIINGMLVFYNTYREREREREMHRQTDTHTHRVLTLCVFNIMLVYI